MENQSFKCLIILLVICFCKCEIEKLQVYKCPDSPVMKNVKEIEIPSYPFNLNLTLSITSTFPGCSDSKEMEEVKYFYMSQEDKDIGMDKSTLLMQVFIGPQEVLSVEGEMYQKQDFCLMDYRDTPPTGVTPDGPHLTFKYCPITFNCSSPPASETCVNKCCPYGMSVSFDESGNIVGCEPSEQIWSGNFYDRTTWKKTKDQKNLKVHYIHKIINCDANKTELWFGRAINSVRDEKQVTRLLSNGNLIYVSGKRRWELLKDAEFCIDGIINVPDSHPYFGGDWPEEDKIVVVCGTKDENNKSRSQSFLYMYCLFGASAFYFLTALIYGLLWDKQNTNGWTTIFLTLSQGLMSVFMGNAHRLGLSSNSEIRGSNICVANAILAHYFMLAAFTWLTLINHNIWSAFRTLSPRSDEKNWKRLGIYLILGFGGPLVVVLVGITLQSIYPDKESLVIVPQYGENICFVAEWAQGVYIYYILGVLLLTIIFFFGATCFQLYKFQKDTAAVRSNSSAKKERKMTILFAKLSIVLGISWIFEFISWALTVDRQQAWYWTIPDIYNLLTSVFVFIIFTWKPSILKQLEDKYPFIKPFTQGVGKVLDSIKGRNKGLSEGSGTHSGTTGLSSVSSKEKEGIKMGRIEMQNSSYENKGLDDSK